ncbi:MAG TPA: beta-eliminating lyase-related protein [Thermoanaerobaculia bacterium]|nr:beta-eliminating lyase-related protein [Thermoanaerobaculia bacterium]
MTTDFRSDNTLPASPEILEAIARVNHGNMTSYGGDEITAQLRERCRELFETELEVFPVITGIAGNALALTSLQPKSITCHEQAHIVLDEEGAVQFFSGATLNPLPGAQGKLAPLDAECLSITNATEAGTVYSPDEVRALCERAKKVHLDGARFANAIASLGCAPADLSWRAGVDVLVLGATKNGGLSADLVIVFNQALAAPMAFHSRRGGHQPSKMRFLSAQLLAYLTDELWLRNARRANAAAARLAKGLANIRGVEILQPVQANILFVRFPAAVSGYQFHEWPIFGEDALRIVTGFATTDDDVDALIAAVASA